MLSIFFYLTGGSHFRRRKRYLSQDDEGVFVDENVFRQNVRSAAREDARGRRERKGKEERVNYNDMDLFEYQELRQGNWYNDDQDEDIEDDDFWCMEQLFIYQDIYAKMSKKVCPMHPLDLEQLSSRPMYAQALAVTEELGLHLMQLRCPFNIHLVMQFYATLAFDGNDARSFYWMSGTTQCKSNFYEFASLLGYPFQGANNPIGTRLHVVGVTPDKNKLANLYGPNGVIGTTSGLLPLYAILVRFFRENIAPSGGNNDAIRTSLVELLHHAYECSINEDPTKSFKIDVMDFIFQEMWYAMLNWKRPPYAPYVMMLINDKLSGPAVECDDEHLVKKLYKTKDMDMDMDDTGGARRSTRRSTSHARRSNSTADRPHMPRTDSRSSAAKEVKKLNWFQRVMLCMNMNIHKEQYAAYTERRTILHNQEILMAQSRGESERPPSPPSPTPYHMWNTSEVDWYSLEQHLGAIHITPVDHPVDPRGPSPAPAQSSEDTASRY